MNQKHSMVGMRSNSSIFKFAVTAMIAISFALVCTSSTAYAKKKRVKYGELLITTNPGGMPISIDGKPEGTTTTQQRRIEIVGLCRRSKGQIRDHPTDIAAAGPEILCGAVQQIAVGPQVVVGVGPRPCDAARCKRANRAGQPQCRIRIGPVVGNPHAFEVLPDVELEGRPAVAEHVVGHAHSRRDVLVGIDARRPGNDERRRQEP